MNKLLIYIILIIFSQKIYAIQYTESNLFPHSSITTQYTPHLDYVKEYNISIISWGNQILEDTNNSQIYLNRKNLIKTYLENGIEIFPVDVAMIKEGVRFLSSETTRNHQSISIAKKGFKKNKLFWEIIQKNSILQKVLDEHSVKDCKERNIYLPWHEKKNKKIPFASIHSSKYTSWLENHIKHLSEIQSNTIHFDEPLSSTQVIINSNTIDCSKKALSDFRNYKEKKINFNNIQTRDKFYSFNIEKSINLIKKLKTIGLLFNNKLKFISINVDPFLWYKYDIARIANFLASEIHFTSRYNSFLINPLVSYKISSSIGKRLISCPYPFDWNSLTKKDSFDIYLKWFALSYANGHHIVMPFANWTGVKNYYKNKFNDYEIKELTNYITKNKTYFDNFKSISDYYLVLNRSHLKALSSEIKKYIKMAKHNQTSIDLIILDKDLYKKPFFLKREKLISHNKIMAKIKDNILDKDVQKYIQQNQILNTKNLEPLIFKFKYKNRLWVFPRKNQYNNDSLVHIINYSHKPLNNKIKSFKINKSLLNINLVKEAYLIDMVNQVKRRITFKEDSSFLYFRENIKSSWNILYLKTYENREQ